MTAEVCLMNTMGVALAADSAVTLGGARGPKIYNSADKLFLLSEHAPVGVMIYGNATLLDVPWETIIKSYRHQNIKSFPTVEEYAEDFLKYLESQSSFFPAPVQTYAAEKHAQLAFGEILENVRREVAQHMEKSGPLTRRQAAHILRRTIKAEASGWLKEVKGRPLLARRLSIATLKRLYTKIIANVENQLFDKIRLTAPTKTILRDCVFETLRREMFTAQATGLVFAGFGNVEFFPAMIGVTIDDVVANRVRWGNLRKERITHQQTGLVMPFAQQEMVYGFMEGIDPRLEVIIETVVEKLMCALPDAGTTEVRGVSERSVKIFRKHLFRYVQAMLPKLWDTLKQYRQNEFASPVTSIVAHLPKDELGSMAEALVHLTSFRRRVTAEAETVGGPIDVAVITKGDGFVWIRRKHYFNAELNPRHMAQHYRKARDANNAK